MELLCTWKRRGGVGEQREVIVAQIVGSINLKHGEKEQTNFKKGEMAIYRES
jgi:hypothetical protein